MNFKEVVEEIVNHYNISGIDLTQVTIGVNINLQNGSELVIQEDEALQVCTLATTLFSLPSEADLPGLYELLLLSQGYGVGTNDAYFTVDLEQRKLILFKNLPLDIANPAYIHRSMDQFFECMNTWQQAHEKGQLLSAIQSKSSDEPQFDMNQLV